MNARYPSATDYSMALQQPTAAFSVPELREAEFKKGRRGLMVIAGSSAVVFHAAIGGRDYALRCYTREDASTPDRYAALDEYVARTQLDRYVSKVRWVDQAVQVKGGRWPVLTMEWIDGRRLNDHVGELAASGDTAALSSLAAQWLTLVSDLQAAEFAHGDLQHGNILVEAAGKLRLVDFDSVWIPPLRGHPAPTETGHASYQPYSLNPADHWGPYMDTFPGLVIYLALLALARAPGLWDKLDNGDNLLFERADLAPPHQTEVWTLLAGLGDPAIDRLAAKLREFCAPDWTAAVTLQAAVTLNWWERTGDPAGTAAGQRQPEPGKAGPALTPRGPGPGTPSSPPAEPSGPSSPGRIPGPRRPAAAGTGTWWDQAAGHGTPAPQEQGAPAARSQRPVARKRAPSPARRVFGGVILALGIVLALVIPVVGAAVTVAVIAVIAGILVMVVPGGPAPPGGS